MAASASSRASSSCLTLAALGAGASAAVGLARTPPPTPLEAVFAGLAALAAAPREGRVGTRLAALSPRFRLSLAAAPGFLEPAELEVFSRGVDFAGRRGLVTCPEW